MKGMEHATTQVPVDDRALAAACTREGEGSAATRESAWSELYARHGLFVDAVVVRVVDERRRGYFSIDELNLLCAQVRSVIAQKERSALRAWHGMKLRPLLGVLARHCAEEVLVQGAATVPIVTHLPSTETTTELSPAESYASSVSNGLSRLAPHLLALLRLRMRGLALGDMATTLGQPQGVVCDELRRVAKRISAVRGEFPEDVWRVLLDCASVGEQITVAIRTEDDAAFQRARAVAEATWRELTQLALARPPQRTEGPLSSAAGVAAFVDGSMRGSERSRAEGHLATCQRAVDTVAMAVMDLRSAETLRSVLGKSRNTALSVCCLANGRYAAGRLLAERAADEGDRTARWLTRLAQAGLLLRGDREPRTERSGLQSMTQYPGTDEAQVLAFEALAAGEATAAYRAIDERGLKKTIGQRLRLLAGAAGTDLPEAARQAAAVLAAPSVDPGLARDAALVMALPSDRALPREILVRQLRDAIPDAVRFVISLPEAPS